MQTGIPGHATDKEQAIAMNITPNRGGRRKEKEMHAITKAVVASVFVMLGLTLAASAAEPPKAEQARNQLCGRSGQVLCAAGGGEAMNANQPRCDVRNAADRTETTTQGAG